MNELNETFCYKIVKDIPYLRVKAVSYLEMDLVNSPAYLNAPDGKPLTFDTKREAHEWLVENVKERYLPRQPFGTLLPDNEYLKYDSLAVKPTFTEKGFKEWFILAVDDEGELIYGTSTRSEKEKDQLAKVALNKSVDVKRVTVRLRENVEVYEREIEE